MADSASLDGALRQQTITNTVLPQLVSCGAGGGKTSLLVAHYVHLLAEGVSPHEIVAVTFTELAAAELKERLRRECRRRAQSGAKDRDWKALGREIETAPVSTIHGFCARVLREYALAAGLDPAFEVLDETQSRLLLAERVRQSLLDGLAHDRGSAARLVGELGLRPAADEVATLVERRGQLGQWLTASWTAGKLVEHWNQKVDEALAQGIADLLASEQWKQDVAHVKLYVDSGARDELAKRCGEVLSLALEVEQKRSRDALEGLLGYSKQIRTNAGHDSVACQAAKAASSLKNKTGATGKHVAALTALTHEGAESPAALLTEALLAEAQEAIKVYEAAKAEQHALDFEDLQLRVRDLWRQRPDILQRMRKRVWHLLIDEYQDTSRLQEEVLGALAGEGGARRFVVGDPKQSIYGWRDADLNVWYQTRQAMEEASGAQGYVPLKKCFRSTPTLLRFFNTLFAHPAVMGTPPADPRPYVAYYETELEPHRTDERTPAAELLLVSGPPSGGEQSAVEGEEKDEEASTADLRFAEAKLLANRVRELVNGDEPLEVLDREKGEHRRAEFRDFALLLRSFGDVQIYEWAFRQAGIPTYVYAGKGYFHAQEVRDIISALRAIENVEDEVALVGALRSPLFGLSDETLFWVSHRRVGSNWWQRLVSVAGEPSLLAEAVTDDERYRLRQAVTILGDLRARKNRWRLSELIRELIGRTQLLVVLASLPGAPQTTANLQKLVDIAAAYELTGSYNLRGFLKWLQELQVREVREGEAAVEDERSNSVKFMTQHAAKGLEWPVVILPDLNRRQRPQGERFRWHPDLGCMAFLKHDSRDQWPGFGQLLGDRRRAEEVAEARRLFYVACTRARDHLILASGLRTKRDTGKVDLFAGSPLAWLLEALGISADELATLVTNGGSELPLNDCWSDLMRASLYRMTEVQPVAASSGTCAGSEQPQGPQQVSVAQLKSQIGPVSRCYAARRRFTATELAVFGFCPRRYELTYIVGWPTEGLELPTLTPGDQLTALERGDVIHHLLRLVGTQGVEELDKVLNSELGLPADLEVRAKRQKDELRTQVARFLESDLYRNTVQQASELRTEMRVVFPLGPACADPLPTVAIEGVVDAFVADGQGRAYILDYKTGSADDSPMHQMYEFQVGLYCAAVQKWRGQYPAKAWLVYLQPDQTHLLELEVPVIAEEAVKQAASLVTAIRQGAFAPPEAPPCPSCPLRSWCPDAS